MPKKKIYVNDSYCLDQEEICRRVEREARDSAKKQGVKIKRGSMLSYWDHGGYVVEYEVACDSVKEARKLLKKQGCLDEEIDEELEEYLRPKTT